MARTRVKKTTPTGTTCSDCGEPQIETPSGVSCGNGHGGAPALEETRPARSWVDDSDPVAALAEVMGDDDPPVGQEPEGPPTKPTRKRGVMAQTGSLGDKPVRGEARERARKRVAEGIAATAPLEPKDGILASSGPVPAQLTDLDTNDAALAAGVELTFVSLPTRRLIETERPEELLRGGRIEGAIVKVTTNVRSNEREAFDGVGIKARLLEHGARAVVLAPRIVSAGGISIEAKMAAAKSVTDEEAVRAWFAGQTGLSDDELEEAIARTLAILESV